MGSIKTTQIDGDVSVGRNIAIGGDVAVQGAGRVNGNLKVCGWLDAKNIKGANKGMFTTVDKLREAYPTPQDGWWAIVGSSLPGPIYVGYGGVWVSTGQTGGSPTLDSDAVGTLQHDVILMQEDILAVEQKNEAQDASLKELSDKAGSLQTQVGNLRLQAMDLDDKVELLDAAYTSLSNSKGKAYGLAPLGGDARVPASYLPGDIYDVMEFAVSMEMDGVTVLRQYTHLSSTDTGCCAVYDRTHHVFVLCVEGEDEDGEVTLTYYNDWGNADKFGTVGGVYGRSPQAGKVYVYKEKNILYRWGGSGLVPIGSHLTLGHTADSAFPGSEGASLTDRVGLLEKNKRSVTLDEVNGLMEGLSTTSEWGTAARNFLGVHDLVASISGVLQKVGEVRAYLDDSLHQLTVEVSSNYYLSEDGTLGPGHHDGASHTYRRHFGLSSTQITRGAWTPWTNVEPMSEADKSKLDLYPAQMMVDFGLVGSQDAGYEMASRSEIAGNRNVSFIRFMVNGVSALKTTLIIQWPNGINETGQLAFVDKAQWRRNVSGTTGNAGDKTTATMWERTSPHYLGYDAANRKIQLKDYTQAVSRDVQLPLADGSTDGLLGKNNFVKLMNFNIYESATPSTSSVVVNYLLPMTGVLKSFSLNQATTARAGVMTASDKSRLDALVKASEVPDYVEMVFESYDSLRSRKVLPAQENFSYINVDGTTLYDDGMTPVSGDLRLYLTGGRHVVRCRPVSWDVIGLFSGCDGLVEVSLPSGVTSLPIKCFESCNQLRSISLPDGLLTVGAWAFLNCWSLEEVVFPDSVTTIGEKCFDQCTSMRRCTLGVGCQRVEQYAFIYCSALEEVVILSEALTLGGSGGTFPFCFKLGTIRCTSGTAPACESTSTFTDSGNVGRDVTASARKLYRPAGATSYTDSTSRWKTGLMDTCGFTVVDAI